MKTLVIGDLHGKYEIAEEAVASPHNVIFVGDYLDSFDRSIEDQIQTLRIVTDACRNEPNRVQALRGNHEMSYMVPGIHKASGWKLNTHSHLVLMSNALDVLQDYVWVNGWLISHSGVSKKLLDASKQTLGQYLEESNFDQIGRARGGWDKCGGLYWCDWWEEFVPLPQTPQIVGHSSHRPDEYGIVKKGNSYNIDTYDNKLEFLFILEDGTIEIQEKI